VGVFFQDRVALGIRKLKELIEAGRLGKTNPRFGARKVVSPT